MTMQGRRVGQHSLNIGHEGSKATDNTFQAGKPVVLEEYGSPYRHDHAGSVETMVRYHSEEQVGHGSDLAVRSRKCFCGRGHNR